MTKASFLRVLAISTLVLMLANAPSFLWADDGSGLEISAAIDLLGETGLKSGSGAVGRANDKFEPREVEVAFYAPIDPIFDGHLSLAAHPEEGAFLFELHEATISSSRLIPRSRIKLGQFFLGVGRLNQTHRHDWSFVSAPYVHKEFFDDEGVLDSGIEYAYLTPLPFYLDLSIGLTNGFTYGHTHSEGKKPVTPTHYLRLTSFLAGSQIGFNALSRKASGRQRQTLLGLDFVYKKRGGRVLRFLLEAEAWQRHILPPNGPAEINRGLWFSPQVHLGASFFFGNRLDYFTVSSLKDAGGESVANAVVQLVPTLTWKPSEFSTFKLAYEWTEASQAKQKKQVQDKVELQMSYVIGAHPAHSF